MTCPRSWFCFFGGVSRKAGLTLPPEPPVAMSPRRNGEQETVSYPRRLFASRVRLYAGSQRLIFGRSKMFFSVA